MIEKWHEICIKFDLPDSDEECIAYFREVCKFHSTLCSLLTLNISAKEKNSFSDFVSRIRQNNKFFIQFFNPGYRDLIFSKTVEECSGTYGMRPTQCKQLPKVLKNFQDYCEFIFESRMVGHANHSVVSCRHALDSIRSQVQVLTDPQNVDRVLVEGKQLLQICSKHMANLVDEVFAIVGVRKDSYKFGEVDLKGKNLLKKISLLPPHNKEIAIGLIRTVDMIRGICTIVEDSILFVKNPEFVKKYQYQNRMTMFMRSFFKEIENFKDGFNPEDFESLLITSPSALPENLTLSKSLQTCKEKFFFDLIFFDFYARARDYLTESDFKCQKLSLQYTTQRIYDILKKHAFSSLEMLQQECSKRSSEDFNGISLFHETQWLAKAMFLIQDMGKFLQDSTISEDLDFPIEYLKLISRYDVPVSLPKTEQKLGDMDVNPPLPENVEIHPLPLPPTSEPQEIAALPKISKEAPAPKPVRFLIPHLPMNAKIPPKQPEMPDNKELKRAIRSSQGDLRVLNQVLKEFLGWGIEKNGKRHPTIVDEAKRPIAPVPETGHAKLGTLLNVANVVCNTAAARNLVK